jgi:hypothetical protein
MVAGISAAGRNCHRAPGHVDAGPVTIDPRRFPGLQTNPNCSPHMRPRWIVRSFDTRPDCHRRTEPDVCGSALDADRDVPLPARRAVIGEPCALRRATGNGRSAQATSDAYRRVGCRTHGSFIRCVPCISADCSLGGNRRRTGRPEINIDTDAPCGLTDPMRSRMFVRRSPQPTPTTPRPAKLGDLWQLGSESRSSSESHGFTSPAPPQPDMPHGTPTTLRVAAPSWMKTA